MSCGSSKKEWLNLPNHTIYEQIMFKYNAWINLSLTVIFKPVINSVEDKNFIERWRQTPLMSLEIKKNIKRSEIRSSGSTRNYFNHKATVPLAWYIRLKLPTEVKYFKIEAPFQKWGNLGPTKNVRHLFLLMRNLNFCLFDDVTKNVCWSFIGFIPLVAWSVDIKKTENDNA